MLEYIFNLVNLFTTIKTYGTASMDSVLASSAVDRGFEPRSGQTKDNKIGIGCFSTKYTTLKSKSKDWLAPNHNNVSELGEMSIRGLLFQ